MPDAYKDITPESGPDGPNYLHKCKLVKMTLKAGCKDVPHYHPAHYMYVVRGGKVKIIGAPAPPGETIEVELKSGDGMIMPEGSHEVENVGDEDIEIYFLEDYNGGMRAAIQLQLF